MKYEEVYDYVYSKISYFPKDSIDDLMEILMDCDEDAFEKIKKTHLKNPTLIQIVSALLGIYGVDRFLIGDYALGIFKFITAGGFLAMWIADIFTIKKSVREYNYNKVKSMASPSLEAIIRDIQPK